MNTKNTKRLILISIILISTKLTSYSQDITTGLIGHWQFNGNAADISGSGNDGIVSGAVLTEDRNGNANNAYGFNGSNSKIDINLAIDEVSETNTGSWSVWIRNNNPTNPYATQSIITFSGIGSTVRLALHVQATSGKIRGLMVDETVQWILETDNPILANTWYHVVLVQDGVSPKLYINDELIAQTFTNSSDNSKWFDDVTTGSVDNGKIGSRQYSSFPEQAWFDGIIDDLRIYNRPLSSSDIASLYVNDANQSGNFIWKANTNNDIYYDSGNVGIGITTPDSKLVVDGKIKCEEIKVEIIAGTGPDYVFEPEYKLRTLQETKEYIAQHKHLPEIPSAREMEVAGVDLGEMNMKLLKKVEELTLYQIELLERLEKAEKKIQQLETR